MTFRWWSRRPTTGAEWLGWPACRPGGLRPGGACAPHPAKSHTASGTSHARITVVCRM